MPRIQVDYYSFSLNMNTHATVILPQTGKDFLSGGVRRNKDGKIPVLWLLHGFGDDSTSWERYTHVERYALARGIAVVMPGVLSQCFYSNMVKGLPYFDHIANEVPALFREMFPQLSDAPEDNPPRTAMRSSRSRKTLQMANSIFCWSLCSTGLAVKRMRLHL